MKVLVVEDHPIVVSGCRQLFADHASIAFLDAATIAEARIALRNHTPDVIVIDVNLPDGSGLEFVRELGQGKRRTKIVVFSMSDDPMMAMRAFDYGANGFVSKNDRPGDLLKAVQAVVRGDSWLSEDLLQQVAFMRAVPELRPPQLKRREKNILKLLVGGRHPSEIAKELNISPKVVSTDCVSIRQKLNARTTAEMVAIAIRSNIGG